MPRDIESQVNSLDNVYLYDIDDLQLVVAANISEREKEIPLVEAIIKKYQKSYLNWYNSLEMVPTIVSLRQKMEDIRISELSRLNSKLSRMSSEDQEQVDILTKSIINKILHEPVTILKQQAEESDGYLYVEVLGKLFNLNTNNPEK